MKVLILFVSLFCTGIMVLPVYGQNDDLLGSALRDNILANDTDLRGGLKKDKKKTSCHRNWKNINGGHAPECCH